MPPNKSENTKEPTEIQKLLSEQTGLLQTLKNTLRDLEVRHKKLEKMANQVVKQQKVKAPENSEASTSTSTSKTTKKEKEPTPSKPKSTKTKTSKVSKAPKTSKKEETPASTSSSSSDTELEAES